MILMPKGNMLDNSIQAKKETPESILFGSLTIKEAEKGKVSFIHRGRWSKADLSLIFIRGHQLVLKDFSRKSFFIRLLGRLQIWREVKAYHAMQGIAGVPKFYKKLSPWSFVIEYVEGVRLAGYKGEIPLSVLVEDLRKKILVIHQAGVFHNDIRGRENVVVTKSGQLIILDFAGALYLRPGSLLHKTLSPLIRWVDYSAYLKWKSQLTPEDMSEREQKSLKIFNTLRKFWIFNLKRQK